MDDKTRHTEVSVARSVAVEPQLDHLRHFMHQLNPLDLLSSYGHSEHFNGSRSEYIHARVRVLALVFAFLTPLWIPIDYIIVESAAFQPLAILRIVTAILLLMLGLQKQGSPSLLWSYGQLAAMMAVLSGFFIASHIILGGNIPGGPLIGYTFLPFLMISLLGIFPLTLLEGALVSAMVASAYMGAQIYFGNLLSASALGDLWLISLLVVVALWAEISQLHVLLTLYRQATHDSLTGLFNRHALMRRVQKEADRVQRNQGIYSILLFDLDRFKRINDRYGHLTGDAVLRVFSEILIGESRHKDLIGRYGGEEFVALLPDTTEKGANEIAERIRQKCAKSTACGPQNCIVDFTTSIGVAEARPQESISNLLQRVDIALYKAKDRGRNRVVAAD